MTMVEKYGPWAVVAGASEGTGREFARQLAAAGIPSVLIARRQQPLDELAALIRDETGLECVTAAIDLSAPTAIGSIVGAVADREIGLYVANAGADPNGSHFLDLDVQPWIDLVQRNVMTTMAAAHHFGGLMRQRRRGGLLLVNSGACYGGGGFLACYTASKAFELNFAESLWAELQPYGVDVLTMVLGMTDTPAFRKLLSEKDKTLPEEFFASPVEVAALALERLPYGPVHNWGQTDDSDSLMPAANSRRERVRDMTASSAMIFGEHE
jgi:uncharacterized protein